MTVSLRYSIVIPHAGRRHSLFRCIESLCRQTHPRRHFEIIVVEDGTWLSNTDRQMLRQKSVRVYSRPRNGVSHARNFGILSARARFVVFLDDDTVPSEGLLDAYDSFLRERPSTRAVGGTVLSANSQSTFARYAAVRGHLRTPVSRQGKIVALITANACVERKTLFAIGLFDEQLDRMTGGCGGDDADLSYRLMQYGEVLHYCETAIVEHLHPDTLRKFMAQQVRNGKGLACFTRLRQLRPEAVGLCKATLASVAWHLLLFLCVSNDDCPSVASRCRTYWSEHTINVCDKVVFPFLDVLRRSCQLYGAILASRPASTVFCHGSA